MNKSFNNLIFRNLAIFCLLLTGISPSIAQETTQEPPEAIEEITITQQRPPSLLRREIIQATENVYDLFNSLNDDDEFNVYCYEEYILGSRIKERFCHANYIENALSNVATDYVNGQQGDPESVPGATPHLIQAEIRLKNRILGEKMLELSNNNRQLNDALLHLKDLRDEYSELTAD
ncbi:MAG: hypothetical protein P8M72_06835 [Gammaproteobacteria bacterium]|nr:hypothetical protein [Gammaproteobacteria bacterium]